METVPERCLSSLGNYTVTPPVGRECIVRIPSRWPLLVVHSEDIPLIFPPELHSRCLAKAFHGLMSGVELTPSDCVAEVGDDDSAILLGAETTIQDALHRLTKEIAKLGMYFAPNMSTVPLLDLQDSVRPSSQW